MNILVLGGGIAGVTAAYCLGKDGHAVTVLEANDGLGLEATSGNAGIIAAGHSFAWGSPKAPGMLLRSLLGKETAIRMRLKPDRALYAWGLRFLRECTSARARHNTLIKLRLCRYSARLLREIADAERIDYLFFVHDRHQGNEASMREYLSWEEQLPQQIEADGDAAFKVVKV